MNPALADAVRSDVRALCDEHLEPLLADLVGAESVNPPGNEGRAAAVLVRHLHRIGLDARVHELLPGRANVVAPARAWEAPPAVALCSHLDVVPTGASGAWAGDPFVLDASDGRYVGRGVCDAKGPVAVMALVTAAFARHLPGTVALAAVAGEEAGGVGSKALLDAGFRASVTVIGEPTRMRVARAHKGRVEGYVTVRGSAGHAAMSFAGETAAQRLPSVIQAVQQVTERLSARNSVCGQASLAVTQVASEPGNAATVPASITLTLDRRLVPGETHEEAVAELRAAFEHLPFVQVDCRHGATPCELPEDDPLVQAGLRTDPRGAGSTGLSATCDQYIWHRAGIPGIVLGPGDLLENRAHAAGEFIERADLHDAARRYAEIVLAYMEYAGRDAS